MSASNLLAAVALLLVACAALFSSCKSPQVDCPKCRSAFYADAMQEHLKYCDGLNGDPSE